MRAIRCVPIALAALTAFAATPAPAAHLTTLYSFCRQADCNDGSDPHAIALTSSGAILGTTLQGGSTNNGIVYQLSPPASGHKWREKILHDFCSKPNCTDGDESYSQLNPDGRGNFFGATEEGDGDNGIVFELSPDTGHSGWNFRAIYSFCSQANCADGLRGDGTMVIDTSGNVYGIAAEGGAANKGVVYELSPVTGPGRKGWTEKVLYNFCSAANCADGALPTNGLTYSGAQSGAPYDGTTPLYGTAAGGGAVDGGVVFSLKPMENGNWTETVLHDFCASGTCHDGEGPVASGALAVDTSGNIFGATYNGGDNDFGVIYEVSFSHHKWRETTLYSFCSLPSCIDGKGTANMILDPAGNLYGMSDAALFRLIPDGRHSTFEVLHQFCSQPNCTDGAQPQGNVVMDASGSVYGATTTGGAHQQGTVFKLTP
jgi:uncharacterized repeat protein (TIGR03803 family)